MTVIAWDGRKLAADKLCDANGLRRTVTKVHRHGDLLIGWSGNFARAVAMQHWAQDGADPSQFPPGADDDTWANLLVIDRSGRAAIYENSPYPVVVQDRWVCIGSGRDYAAAAMHLGLDAEQAVKVAIELCTSCGGGVDVLEAGWLDHRS